MDLIATPKNPIPIGASTGYIEPRKGLRVRFASWQSALRERRGTVCIFPGRGEFIEKYFEVVGELRRRGYAVAILDWRGQGGSTRLTWSPLKGHIRDFAEYEEDLAHFMKAVVLPDCPAPFYALAHSMAGAILFRVSTKRGGWFSRMVMTSPMVKIARLPMPDWICEGLADGATMLGLGRLAVPGDKSQQNPPFEGNPLTSDRERFLRNVSVLEVAPQLAIEAPTIGWLRAAFQTIDRINSEAFAPHVRVPVLMLSASDDKIVSNKAVEALATRLKIGSQIVIRGSRHEIMQERDNVREQFWAAFDAFVGEAALSKAS
jgi:lysophospholipase